ncbi:UDP-4-amino-4,6-dideoxy-N-acetyl-beta-L-altrosamine N-acetyltransferase [Catenovulum sp. SM1970]|uniref:UDP-4-amino-4, 6-dideoxy-N-acetyl-beta-L-altrosamine N-acetyltransferase n=1 Tax=Marinifaba aquimaris TaxID=2741323 RepID=UPI0015741A35|nr:UDP-4-amino-4,6-dideoxy-N-acetyl-beta-L-altrosamine N-acetyltransferase [Marinifaba aquimaris]NTS75373.1 UDP-4-amino-4,6-dideoxy-N-acetyl-beta-L-altrosamine N-acetyltransferase [Marinifaba aquimaris]
MFEFKLMTEADLPQVMIWRTSDSVTEFMFTDIKADLDAQKTWFAKVSKDITCCYWLIYYQQKPIGVISINDIDVTAKICSWGFYIGDNNCRNLGGLVPPYFYNHVFLNTDIKAIFAEVMEHNHQVKKLHRLHGYELIRTLKGYIKKGERTFDVDCYQLAKAVWLSKKRFTKLIANFEVESN